MNYCIVDTNVVIYYLHQVGGDDYRKYFDRIVSRGSVISVITRIEVLSWPGYSGNLIALYFKHCRWLNLHYNKV